MKHRSSGHFRKNGERRRDGLGQVRGETHPAAKFSAEDIALARLLAADRSQPKGWITAFAAARGARCASLVMAIGGQTWADLEDPAPVRAYRRVRPSPRPKCSRCHRAKWARGCADVFHRIDHRATHLRRKVA